jgi:hypothetical protein
MLDDLADARVALWSNYYVSERLDPALTQHPMPAPVAEQWVLLPRKRPLRGFSAADLRQIHLRERDLALEARTQEARDDVERLALEGLSR